jgi:FkbM family methyltransferase
MNEDFSTRARRLFYNLNGPWYRCKIAETVGSRRFSHPAFFGMDRRLAELVPRGGTFLEAGAHDGYTQSNTYYLEHDHDCHGVLVEPIPELYTKCKKRRTGSQVFNCALAGPDAPESVTMHFGDLMSAVDDPQCAQGGLEVTGRLAYTVTVPARTLSSVLEEAGIKHVDVMILDLEGHEISALSGLDFERHAPTYLMLETLDGEEGGRATFDHVLETHFTFREMASDYDILYERRF